MTFQKESAYYSRGILSDLQGAWLCLRRAVVKLTSSDTQRRLLLHIDEGMSWESVRDFHRMRKIIVLISNIIQEERLHGDIQEGLEDLHEIFSNVVAIDEEV